MLQITGNDTSYCPYRDCLKIQTTDGRITWYQLLGISTSTGLAEIRECWQQRRKLVRKCRRSTNHPVWSQLLQQLDQAFDVVTDPVSRREYNADLQRRSLQPAMFRLPAHDAAEWRATMHPPEKQASPPRSLGSAKPASPRERYEPIRCVGDGPHGTRVYEAWEYSLNRRVAVRCLNRSARSPERILSFLEEARFLASLSHPNVAEIHSVSERGCFMVMEYLEQKLSSVQADRKHRRCSVECTIQFLQQALSVLQQLHDRGVIHGAISLGSFHVTANGVVKLVDAPGCTPGGLFRTPRADQNCAAPELLSPATFGDPGPPVDLYMLGFTALELIAGDRLNRCIPKLTERREVNQQNWLQWHASPMERLANIQSVLTEIPANLAELIESLCEKQVLDRCRSAADALQLLQTPAIAKNSVETGTTQAVAGDHRRNPSKTPAARIVGGEAPLLCPARHADTHQPELLEILQDPKLLWQTLRTSRRGQLIAGSLAVTLIAGLLLAGSPAQQSPAQAVTDSDLSIDTFATADSSPLPLIPSDNPTPAEEPAEMIHETSSSEPPELEYAAVPLELPVPPAKQPAGNISSTTRHELLPEEVPAFLTGDMDSRRLPELRHLLQQLRNARKPEDRRRLLRAASQIAPQDPRIPFLYAAVWDFRPDARAELEQAVALSPPAYTQPLRQLLQLRLTGAGNRCEIADEVLAELREFAARLSPLPQTRSVTHDWQWIGRMLGCLQQESQHEPRIATMLRHALPLILETAGSHGAREIHAGMAVVAADPGRNNPAVLFPLQPEMASSLCLNSLRHQDTTSPDPDSLLTVTLRPAKQP